MDHDVVVRQKMTEKYLLDELDAASRDEFEEHFFDCPSCAVDVQAGALFIEQSKIALAPVTDGVAPQIGAEPRWFARFRPLVVAPVMALLLAVVGYQNLVLYPRLEQAANSPHLLPWAPLKVATYGSGPDRTVITTAPGKSFLLFVRIAEGEYERYTAELHNPAGTIVWSLTIPAAPGQDEWPIQVPGANLQAGSYNLTVRGVTTAGISKEVGQASFELQIQK
jgi:Putative zinc-finger